MKELIVPDRSPSAGVSLLLLGPTVGCADWQSDMVSYLQNDNATVFNPRPNYTPTSNPLVMNSQRAWENSKMSQADAILIWFPYGGIWGETLMRFGMCLELSKPLFIGVEKEYGFEEIVKTHVLYRRPTQKVHSNLTEMSLDVSEWVTTYNEGCTVIVR